MAQKLEIKYSTWDKLADHIADQIQSEVDDSKFNRSKFLKWFMLRKRIGCRFDYRLIHRAYVIWKQLQKKGDHFTCIVGREGEGKSTIGIQLGAWVSPNMSQDDICYTAEMYINKLTDVAEKYDIDRDDREDKSIQIDEGGIDLFSREAMSASNVTMAKCFMIQRFLNLHVIICIPKYWNIDTKVRERIKTLIIKTSHKSYKCITGEGIDIVNSYSTKKPKINSISIPYGYFWKGNNVEDFPNTISDRVYEQFKLKNIREFLNEQKKNRIERVMLNTREVMAQLGITRPTVSKYIKMGKFRATNIGQKWLINKEDVLAVQNGANP